MLTRLPTATIRTRVELPLRFADGYAADARGPQLREAVERIVAAGGYLLYVRQEGRGIGPYSKLDGTRWRTPVSTRNPR